MRSKLALLAALALSAPPLGGCGQHAIYSPGTDTVRLGEDVQARIYQRDSTGAETLSGNRVTLPAGGYYVPAVATPAPATQPSQ
jgi:hypothetical protein